MKLCSLRYERPNPAQTGSDVGVELCLVSGKIKGRGNPAAVAQQTEPLPYQISHGVRIVCHNKIDLYRREISWLRGYQRQSGGTDGGTK